MTDMSTLIQQGASNVPLLIISALVLGGLHGLEPGHSKTMMAAFIVAVRGTVSQAILLAVSATISHTAIVWAIALLGMHFSSKIDVETSEPYLQAFSGILILGIAFWMIYRIWHNQKMGRIEARHEHHHGADIRRVDTGHGIVALEVFEEGVPPRWRFRTETGHVWHDHDVKVETERPDGKRQTFIFVNKGDYLESVDDIPEPHEFTARLSLGHAGHSHDYDLEFQEHHHNHDHAQLEGLDVSSGEYEDAHARAHANDIRRRFTNRNVTTGQIVMFGLTGGLIPCGAAVTVLLLCLQLKKFMLGVTLVLCFSIGLALTLMASGIFAAWGVNHVNKKYGSNPLMAKISRYAPYLSSVLVVLLGLYVTWSGLRHLI